MDATFRPKIPLSVPPSSSLRTTLSVEARLNLSLILCLNFHFSLQPSLKLRLISFDL